MKSFDLIRPLLEPWGMLKSQDASEWNGEISLPQIVYDYYRELGPWGGTDDKNPGVMGLIISCGGNPVSLPPLQHLWSRQACYRWHGHTGARLRDWKDEWLLIATEGSNPFVLDMESGTVHFALAGGPPEFELFAPNLPTAVGAIGTVGKAYKNLDESYFDDFQLIASGKRRVIEELDRFLEGDFDAEKLIAAWRWYE
jgi:hypothetical protein